MTAEAITFRPLARTDLPLVSRWLNTPHVYKWWGRAATPHGIGGPGDLAATVHEVEEKYGPAIDEPRVTHRYVIQIEDTAVGLIQWYRLQDHADYARDISEPIPGAAGIDYFYWRRGIHRPWTRFARY